MVKFSNMRKNSMNILVEYEELSLNQPVTVNGVEWWNGEGIDFTIDDKKISLSMDDLNAVTSIALAMGMIDLKEVKSLAKKLKGS